MASAERTYVDPSALRSLYVHDDRSAGFCSWRGRLGGALPVTRFGRAEIVNSIHLAVNQGAIDAATAQTAVSDFDEDTRAGRLMLVDLPWRRTLDLTADLSARHSARLGTRTLDVWHVSTAVVLESRRFVTYDKRQRALAEAVGLRVMAP